VCPWGQGLGLYIKTSAFFKRLLRQRGRWVLRSASIALPLASMLGAASFAHDFVGVLRVSGGSEAALEAAFENAPDDDTRQVIEVIVKWPARKPIIVCFHDGNPRLRARVAEIAGEWTPHTSLVFDFGPAGGRSCSGRDTEDIKIAFKSDDGDWSYIGLDSNHPDPKTRMIPDPSMNLGALVDPDISDAEFRAHVLHEFGHAIGFWHEQQHPLDTCDYDRNAIEKDMHWSDADYAANMERVHQQMMKTRQWRFRFYMEDKKSVMFYTGLPARYFLSGRKSPCYRPVINSELSDGDVLAVREMYPEVVPPAEIAKRNAELGALAELANDPSIGDIVRSRINELERDR
jgi:hypothetical protein